MATLASLGRLPVALLTLAVLATARPAAAQTIAQPQPAQAPQAGAAATTSASGVPSSADAHVNALIDARVKDSKLVEFETSEAIAERMIKWAQWFALLVGAPLAILALVLTFDFGIRSYADFRDRLNKAREAIERQMQKAEELQAAHAAIDLQMRRKRQACRPSSSPYARTWPKLSELDRSVRPRSLPRSTASNSLSASRSRRR